MNRDLIVKVFQVIYKNKRAKIKGKVWIGPVNPKKHPGFDLLTHYQSYGIIPKVRWKTVKNESSECGAAW